MSDFSHVIASPPRHFRFFLMSALRLFASLAATGAFVVGAILVLEAVK